MDSCISCKTSMNESVYSGYYIKLSELWYINRYDINENNNMKLCKMCMEQVLCKSCKKLFYSYELGPSNICYKKTCDMKNTKPKNTLKYQKYIEQKHVRLLPVKSG